MLTNDYITSNRSYTHPEIISLSPLSTIPTFKKYAYNYEVG